MALFALESKLSSQWKNSEKPIGTNVLLAPDSQFDSRAFASFIIKDGKFFVFYAARDRKTQQYAIFVRRSNTLEGLRTSKEIPVIYPSDIGAKLAWMPYIIEDEDMFHLFFTVREKQISDQGDLYEYIRKATSNDLVKFVVDDAPVLIPELDWEGSEVENWGIIKTDDGYFMSYESSGKTQQQVKRSIGYAYSKDMITWKRIQDMPFIVGYVCCSSFFKIEDYFYSIAPNKNRFKVFKSKSIEGLDEKSFIGYLYPHGLCYDGAVDTPDVLTKDVYKELRRYKDPITLLFSSTQRGEWITEYTTFGSIEGFQQSLSNVDDPDCSK